MSALSKSKQARTRTACDPSPRRSAPATDALPAGGHGSPRGSSSVWPDPAGGSWREGKGTRRPPGHPALSPALTVLQTRGLRRNPLSLLPPKAPEKPTVPPASESHCRHGSTGPGRVRGRSRPRSPSCTTASPRARLPGQVGLASPASQGHPVLSRPASHPFKVCQPCPALPQVGSGLHGARPGPRGGDMGSTATTVPAAAPTQLRARTPQDGSQRGSKHQCTQPFPPCPESSRRPKTMQLSRRAGVPIAPLSS